MRTDATSVLNGTSPEISETDPYSPSARAKARPAPVRSAGARLGRMILLNVVNLDAPSDAAASSTSRSSAERTGCTLRTANGSVTNDKASTSDHLVKATSIWNGLPEP